MGRVNSFLFEHGSDVAGHRQVDAAVRGRVSLRTALLDGSSRVVLR